MQEPKPSFFIAYKKPLAIGFTTCTLLAGMSYTLYLAINNPQEARAGLTQTWDWMIGNPILCLGLLSLAVAAIVWCVHERCTSYGEEFEEVNGTQSVQRGSTLLGYLAAIYLGNLTYQHKDSPFLQEHWQPFATVAGGLAAVGLLFLLINHFYRDDDEIPVNLESSSSSDHYETMRLKRKEY